MPRGGSGGGGEGGGNAGGGGAGGGGAGGGGNGTGGGEGGEWVQRGQSPQMLAYVTQSSTTSV